MLGALKGVWTVAKHAGKLTGVIKSVSDNRQDIERLWVSFKTKRDTNSDGVQDWTKEEALSFVAEVLILLAKRL